MTWAVKKDQTTWLAPLPSTCDRTTSSLRIEIKVEFILRGHSDSYFQEEMIGDIFIFPSVNILDFQSNQEETVFEYEIGNLAKFVNHIMTI